MKEAIRYLELYIHLLESQIPKREEYYSNYVGKVKPLIKIEIDKLKALDKE